METENKMEEQITLINENIDDESLESKCVIYKDLDDKNCVNLINYNFQTESPIFYP